MSAASFTPGPWKVITEATAQEIEVFEIAEVSHFRVIRDSRGDGFLYAGHPHADARLIAAAPDLLAFAQWFIENRNGSGRQMARAAIARATKQEKQS